MNLCSTACKTVKLAHCKFSLIISSHYEVMMRECSLVSATPGPRCPPLAAGQCEALGGAIWPRPWHGLTNQPPVQLRLPHRAVVTTLSLPLPGDQLTAALASLPRPGRHSDQVNISHPHTCDRCLTMLRKESTILRVGINYGFTLYQQLCQLKSLKPPVFLWTIIQISDS